MDRALQPGKKPEVDRITLYKSGAKIVPAYLLGPVRATKANAAKAFANDPVPAPRTRWCSTGPAWNWRPARPAAWLRPSAQACDAGSGSQPRGGAASGLAGRLAPGWVPCIIDLRSHL